MHELHARQAGSQPAESGSLPDRQNKMPNVDLANVIRHCSRCAAKTELCVTVISFEALVSFDSKVFTACLSSRETSELAVDLCYRTEIRNSRIEIRFPDSRFNDSRFNDAKHFSLERR